METFCEKGVEQVQSILSHLSFHPDNRQLLALTCSFSSLGNWYAMVLINNYFLAEDHLDTHLLPCSYGIVFHLPT